MIEIKNTNDKITKLKVPLKLLTATTKKKLTMSETINQKRLKETYKRKLKSVS